MTTAYLGPKGGSIQRGCRDCLGRDRWWIDADAIDPGVSAGS